jgi:tRNA(Ile)-lysidine synthase
MFGGGKTAQGTGDKIEIEEQADDQGQHNEKTDDSEEDFLHVWLKGATITGVKQVKRRKSVGSFSISGRGRSWISSLKCWQEEAHSTPLVMQEEPLLTALRKAFTASKTVKVGVALSGGLDSMVMAEGLYRLRIPWVALHVNHGWRGKQSDEDAQWVNAWCLERGIPFSGVKLGVRVPKTEAGAREARLAFFQKMATHQDLEEIWLAHHADDLVETFLLQLLRGAGPEGLASMPERRSMGKLRLVRPLLDFRKSELLALAKIWKLRWREDASNQSGDYLRNRVRKGLLPYLKKMSGRDPAPALARCARIISDENVHWEGLLPSQWPEELPCAGLKKATIALQRRTIRGWLMSRKISDLSFGDIEQVRGMLVADKPARVNLSQGRYCRRRAGVLFID